MENILKVKIVLFQRLITEKYFYVFFEHLKQTWRKFEEKNWNFFREAQFFFQKSSYSVILLIKFWKVKNSHNFVMGLFSARQNFRATERSKIATWAKNSPVWSHWWFVLISQCCQVPKPENRQVFAKKSHLWRVFFWVKFFSAKFSAPLINVHF